MSLSNLSPSLIHEIEKRIQILEDASSKASESLLRMKNGALNVRTKSNELDPVTAADLESERIITEAIRSQFPMDGILAEEGSTGSVPHHETDFIWVIDPLDGTVNYTHGIPLYSVAIGLVHNGVPVAGIVALPELGDVYRAITGRGAYKNNSPIRVSNISEMKKSIICTGFPYNRQPIMNQLVKGVESVLSSAGGIRRTGSAALDLCWVAEGRFDGFYEAFLNPWDTCASTIILREAGGKLTNLDDEDYDPLNHRFVIASNGNIQDRLRSLVIHFKEIF